MNEKAVSESDSDDDFLTNTIGNVPIAWYDNFDHVGYDLSGKKISKPADSFRRLGEIDRFLKRMDDGGYWRSVYDSMTGKRIQLTDSDIKLVRQINNCASLTELGDNPYADWPDTFTATKLDAPIINNTPSKRSFLPSIDERRAVGRYLHAIKMGWMKTPKHDAKAKDTACYDLWASKPGEEKTLRSSYISAPKVPLPDHRESYNPPEEYRDESQQYPSCLRHVPAYGAFTQERFERLLDLYLCPRAITMRARFDPADILPSLPSPKDLRPFPVTLARRYKYDSDKFGPLSHFAFDRINGTYFGCCGTVFSLWSSHVEKQVATIDLGDGNLTTCAWNPTMPMVAIASATKITFVVVGKGTEAKFARSLLSKVSVESSSIETNVAGWNTIMSPEENDMLCRSLEISVKKSTELCWHSHGDYLASVQTGSDQPIVVHQISKRHSLCPFHRTRNNPMKYTVSVAFHPNRPQFFISSGHSIRIFDLTNGKLMRTLKVGGSIHFNTPLAVHPSGDHVIVGCSDFSLRWFDLEYSDMPYKTMRTMHKQSTIRGVCIHPRLPLMASISIDGRLVVTHAKVYNDLIKDPLIVPVKVLQQPRSRKRTSGEDEDALLKTLIDFNPRNPWLLVTGPDVPRKGIAEIRLYVESTR